MTTRLISFFSFFLSLLPDQINFLSHLARFIGVLSKKEHNYLTQMADPRWWIVPDPSLKI